MISSTGDQIDMNLGLHNTQRSMKIGFAVSELRDRRDELRLFIGPMKTEVYLDETGYKKMQSVGRGTMPEGMNGGGRPCMNTG